MRLAATTFGKLSMIMAAKRRCRRWVMPLLAMLLALACMPPAGAHERKPRIKPEDVHLADMKLHYGMEYWHVRGNVVNVSAYDLQAFILLVRIRDCAEACIVVAEQYIPISGLKLPPVQKRAFHKVLTFPNKAKAKKPKHEFVVVRAFEDYSEYEYYVNKRYRPFDLSEW